MRLFPQQVGRLEHAFRIVVIIWFGLMLSIGILFFLGLVTGADVFFGILAITGPAFALSTPALFFFALAMIISNAIRRRYDFMFGYLVYIALLTLFMLPVFFALYDSYMLKGRFF